MHSSTTGVEDLAEARVSLLPESIPLDRPNSTRSISLRLFLVCAIVFVDNLGVSIILNVTPVLVDPSLPTCLEGMGNVDAGSAFAILMFAFNFGMMFSPPLFGKLSDLYGRRPLLLFSIVGMSVLYGIQSVTYSFWAFTGLRFVIGLMGGGRPVASAYICDITSDVKEQIRGLAWMNIAPAISYGLGPPLGGFLAGYCGVMSPLTAVSILATAIAILSWYYLTEDAVKLKQVNDGRVGETALNDQVDGPVPTARAGLSRNLFNKTALYMTVFMIGLLANAMYMMVFLSFPLVLKDEFSFSPFQAGMTGIGDGVLAILGNWLYMYLATKICIRVSYICLLACSSGVVACLTPIFFDSILGFLAIRYAMGLACPLIFSSLPQIVAMISPPGRGGEFMGYLNMFLSIGNVIPTPVGGPLYEHCLAFLTDTPRPKKL
ncbi:hypothetical protein FOZ60_007864 [Perkinsus olseni]|uniref:Major facilitator superfamily (MFS) profile domain-containing protein n=1 Tax=Perkinsus olseni TaxID=32597 RepID=A0A7J6NL80_PEROL|nr:hypothetical protein FOZ60_007864 [Perkinsus olseni]